MHKNLPGMSDRFIVSICGGSGSGKSTLAKLVHEGIGDEWSTRILTDFFLRSNPYSMLEEFFKHPLEYDWELIEKVLLEKDGQILSTPDYDFVQFQRISSEGGRSFVMRPIVILDGMLPTPGANLTVFMDAPDDERRRRIHARDKIWQKQVILYWAQHQLTLEFLKSQDIIFDLVLDGRLPAEVNAETVIACVRQRFPGRVPPME